MANRERKGDWRHAIVRGAWLLPLAFATAAHGSTRTVIDTTASFDWPSIKVGGDGLGLTAYYDRDRGNLKVAHCIDLPCSGATITVLDSMGDVGEEASLAIGTDGLGLIAYLDATDYTLQVAHCSNAGCTAATLTTLADSWGQIALAIGSDGLGLATYWYPGQGIRVAHCDNVVCTSASTASVADSPFPNGIGIAVGGDGRALIAFMDSVTNRLSVAHCNDVACTSSTVSEVDVADCHTSPTRPLSVVTGLDGLGLIAYTDMNDVLKVAHCLDSACSASTLAEVETGLNGQDVGFTLGADGLGLIGFEFQNNLMLAHCNNRLCSRASIVPFDTGGLAGNKSLTLGSDGKPLIGYFIYEGFYLPRLKVTRIDPATLFDVIFADGFE